MTQTRPTAVNRRLSPRARTLLPAVLSLLASEASLATNGMDLEAYGAKAGGMGGASFAYDSGNSGVMNNPATLALRGDNQSDFGLGLTLLAPNVSASHPMAGGVDSSGTAYWMPSIGYIRNQGDFTFSLYANRVRVAVTEAHRQAVTEWLSAHPAIASFQVGPLVDAWHPAQ